MSPLSVFTIHSLLLRSMPVTVVCWVDFRATVARAPLASAIVHVRPARYGRPWGCHRAPTSPLGVYERPELPNPVDVDDLAFDARWFPSVHW